MQGFELMIYTKANGETPVLEFLQTLPEKIVITNGFVKKTEKTPIREILRVKKYRDDYRKRRNRYDD